MTSATKSNGIKHTMPYWDERLRRRRVRVPRGPHRPVPHRHPRRALRPPPRLVRRGGRQQSVRRHPLRSRAGGGGHHRGSRRRRTSIRSGISRRCSSRCTGPPRTSPGEASPTPSAQIWSGAMMLEHLGHADAARAVERRDRDGAGRPRRAHPGHGRDRDDAGAGRPYRGGGWSEAIGPPVAARRGASGPMPVEIVAIVLIAALAHASWNALVKGDDDRLVTPRCGQRVPVRALRAPRAGAAAPGTRELAVPRRLRHPAHRLLHLPHRVLSLRRPERGLSARARPVPADRGGRGVRARRRRAGSDSRWRGVAVVCAGIASLSARGARPGCGRPSSRGRVRGRHCAVHRRLHGHRRDGRPCIGATR